MTANGEAVRPQPRGRAGAVARYRQRFGRDPSHVVRAPGRVNLIGEHTDYNDGLVLPMAIEPALWLAFEPAEDVQLVSDDADGAVVFATADPGGERLSGWGIYVQGVARMLGEAGTPVRGLRGAIASDIPTGAGLSSSAALELAVARAMVPSDHWQPVEMARLAQRVENAWVGVDSGIMDQLVCACGRAGSALLIDCRSLEVEPVALPEGVVVVVLDTGSRRELASSQYNDRFDACRQAARLLGVAALRDADPEAVEGLADERLRRRARHVVGEIARTRALVDALRAGDLDRVSSLLAAAHASMRDDFEASGPELDAMVAAATRSDGCVGARMTGGGFAGCAVAVVDRNAVDAFTTQVVDAYTRSTDLEPRLHVTRPADGVTMMES